MIVMSETSRTDSLVCDDRCQRQWNIPQKWALPHFRCRRCVETLRTASPSIANATDFAQRFHVMLVGRDIEALDPWLAEAAASSLALFARRVSRDVDAVRAALTLPGSAGLVEGKINKLKLIKCSMYGRAGLDLLRARVMA
jgi:transposase